jgi:hypothetical protein
MQESSKGTRRTSENWRDLKTPKKN